MSVKKNPDYLLPVSIARHFFRLSFQKGMPVLSIVLTLEVSKTECRGLAAGVGYSEVATGTI